MNTLLFLGTGTSSGIPVLGCTCATCMSDDPRDRRFRTGAYIVLERGTKLLIDIGPDFRLQALFHQIYWIDGILITHSHQDHIGGLDELRQLNFLMKRHIPLYGNALSLKEIQARFDYIFKTTQKGGGKPQVDLHCVNAGQEFSIHHQRILPLAVMHGQLQVLGYQIGGLSYITDASYLSRETCDRLKQTDVLVINALRYREHPTHLTLEQTLDIIERIQPRVAYLIHMTHDIRHSDVEKTLPSSVHLAYDNLKIEF